MAIILAEETLQRHETAHIWTKLTTRCLSGLPAILETKTLHRYANNKLKS
jgi:hypothetical protein